MSCSPAVTLGAASLGSGVVLGGVVGASGPAVLAATAVCTWTAGQTGVELADHASPAETGRYEVVRVRAAGLLAAAAAGVVLLAHSLPVSASPFGVALVLFGGVCLAATVLLDG